jgi:MazG family protein
MPTRRRKQKPRKRSTHLGPAFEKLVATMARLRAPNGCPWDREQTHSTLRTYLLEETYELLDALESSDDAKFADELGDLLLQILFHSQIAHEQRRFDISTVISHLHQKLIRRHPHVFGKTSAKNSAEVLRNWEQIKLQERQSKQAKHVKESKEIKQVKEATEGKKPNDTTASSFISSTSLLDGIPRTLPALLEAYQLTRKAARIGFDWPNLQGIFAKLDEETTELQYAIAAHMPQAAPVAQGESALVSPPLSGGSPAAFSSPSSPLPPSTSAQIESELGDLLFVAVNLARFLNLDPELALKKSNAKFSRRFREMERLARAQGSTLAKIPRPQMESLWNQSKLLEKSAPIHEPPK